MIFPQSHTLGLEPRPHGPSSRGVFPTGSHMEVALSSIKLHSGNNVPFPVLVTLPGQADWNG